MWKKHVGIGLLILIIILIVLFSYINRNKNNMLSVVKETEYTLAKARKLNEKLTRINQTKQNEIANHTMIDKYDNELEHLHEQLNKQEQELKELKNVRDHIAEQTNKLLNKRMRRSVENYDKNYNENYDENTTENTESSVKTTLNKLFEEAETYAVQLARLEREMLPKNRARRQVDGTTGKRSTDTKRDEYLDSFKTKIEPRQDISSCI